VSNILDILFEDSFKIPQINSNISYHTDMKAYEILKHEQPYFGQTNTLFTSVQRTEVLLSFFLFWSLRMSPPCWLSCFHMDRRELYARIPTFPVLKLDFYLRVPIVNH
jgi:hypothetical protein